MIAKQTKKRKEKYVHTWIFLKLIELHYVYLSQIAKIAVRRLTFHKKKLGLTMVLRGFWTQNDIKLWMNVLKSSHTTAQE